MFGYGNYIEWEIVIGDGFTDMSGKIFKDTLKGNQSYIFNYPIRIEAKLGAAATGWGPVYNGSGNWSGGLDGTWHGVPTKLAVLPGQKEFTYTVPNASPAGVNKWMFRLVFRSNYDPDNFNPGDMLRNEFYETNGSGLGDWAEVGVGDGLLAVNKELRQYQNHVRYTITADIPSNLQGKRLVFRDDMTTGVTLENYAENMRIQVRQVGSGTLLEDVAPDSLGSNWYYRQSATSKDTWYLAYGRAANKDADVYDGDGPELWPYNFQTQITITYDLPHTMLRLNYGGYNNSNIPHSYGDTLGDFIMGTARTNYDYIQNTVVVASPNGHAEDWAIIYPMIGKKGYWREETRTFDYIIALNMGTGSRLSEGYPATAPIISDVHDPYLELVPGSMMVVRTYPITANNLDRAWLTACGDIARGYFKVTNQVQIDAANNEWTLNFGDIPNTTNGGSNGWVTQRPWPINNDHKNDYGGLTGFGEKWTWEDYDWWNCSDSSYVIIYSLRPKAGAELPPLNVHGVASIENNAWLQTFTDGNPGVIYGAKEQLDFRPLKKTMDYTGGSLADVEIEINRAGGNLLAGTSATVIEIHDKMSTNLALVESSLKVFAFEGGTWVEKTKVLGSLTVPYGYIIDNDQEFRMALPDRVPIKLTYQVEISGNVGDDVTLKNAVKVTGYAVFEDVFEKAFTLSNTSGSGGADKGTLEVWKRDSYTANLLSGAHFGLYVSYEPPSDKWAAAKTVAANLRKPPPAGIGVDVKDTIVVNGRTYYFIMARETVNGFAKFGAVSAEENLIAEQTYALLELQAPPGYITDGTAKLIALEQYEVGYGASEGVQRLTDNTITITNDPGVKLPETGSLSGQPFIQAGAIIFALMGAVLFTTRRRAGDCS